MFARFWLKTALYRYTPGGFGYYRRLRRYRDPSAEAELHEVRHRHNAASGWGEARADGLRTRDYASYDEYVTHQRQKLDEMLRRKTALTENGVVASYRRKFFRRFRHLPSLLPRSAVILCLGARLGTEVEVLRDLGFDNAKGIDLNPGPENVWVEPGDFMHLAAGDASVDLVYSNCIDHAFDLDAFFAEHARVLKPDGYALYDFAVRNDDTSAAFESVVWSDDAVVLEQMERHFGEVVRREREDVWEWLLLRARR